MKLLFVTDNAYPDHTANSEIAFRLAEILRDEYHCDISFIFRGNIIQNEDYSNSCGFKLFQVKTILQYAEIKKIHSRILRRFMLLLNPELMRCAFNASNHKRYYEAEEYQHTIRKVIRRNNYDCIIAVSYPPDSLIAVSRINTSVPYISYKLAPWSNNQSLIISEADRSDEKSTDERASAIVITDLMRKELDEQYCEKYLYKTYELNFPNIVHYPSNQADHIWGEGTHFVFAGRLYNSIRNPQYAFYLFEQLKQYHCYFHIVGHDARDFEHIYHFPDNVIFHGKVNSEEALSFMQSADVLVNIGNTSLNQMPSKILTYISLGKPIINIIKISDCPTLSYMEKYPLGLSILETEKPTENDVKQIAAFAQKTKGKQVPFETIKKLYYDCTPEYVGKRLYEIICEVIHENNKQKTEQCLT